MATKIMKYLTPRADTFAHQRSLGINFLLLKPQSSIPRYHNFTKTRIHADTRKAAASAIATGVVTSNRAVDEEPNSSVRNRDSFVDDNKNLACHSNSRMRRFYLDDCDVNERSQQTGYNNNDKESIQSCNDNDTTPGWKFRSLKNRSCSENISFPSSPSSSSSSSSSPSSVRGCGWSPISPTDPLVWPSSVSAFPMSMRSTGPTETPIYDHPHYMAALIGPTDSGYSSEDEYNVDVDDAKDKDLDEPEAEWTLPFYMEGNAEHENEQYIEREHRTLNDEEETAIVTMASIASFVSLAFSFEPKESTKASDDDDPSFKVVTKLRTKLEKTEHETRLAKANLSDLVLSQIGGQHGWWQLPFAYGQDGAYSLW